MTALAERDEVGVLLALKIRIGPMVQVNVVLAIADKADLGMSFKVGLTDATPMGCSQVPAVLVS